MSDAPLVHRPAASIVSKTPPAEYFSGAVQMEILASPTGFECETLRVNFFPGARTAWHTHPVGQILIVTSGNGIVATRTWSKTMTTGDVIEIPADVEHWHGAAPDTPMTHIAAQPGGSTQWTELVSDEDYLRLYQSAS